MLSNIFIFVKIVKILKIVSNFLKALIFRANTFAKMSLKYWQNIDFEISLSAMRVSAMRVDTLGVLYRI